MISIDTSQLDGLIGDLERAGDKVKPLFRDIVTELVTIGQQRMRREIKADDLVDTGALMNSVTTYVGFDRGKATGRVEAEATHAATMNWGRRPGARLPPIAPLQRYLERKRGVSVEESRSAAWGLAVYIQKHGIEGRGFRERVELALSKIAKRVAVKRINQWLDRQFGGV